jgi:histone deacetylase 1/2
MVTRARAGIYKPNPRYANVATVPDPPDVPSSIHAALRDDDWRLAMQEEHNALLRNRTWRLVPRPPGVRVLSGKWILKNKLCPDGSLERRKARWVLRGDVQRPGIDFDQTFSPVVKPATIRTVLTLAASNQWPVHQLDVSNAFLHGTLKETVYCQQPTGFVDADHPDYVCLLDKSLYGLRQAPRAWYQSFAAYLHSIGFVTTGSDASLFILRRGTDTAWLLLYVDDIVLTASSATLLRRIIHDLCGAFAMKDMGPLHYFLGIQVRRTTEGFFLHQQQYAEDILDRAGMLNCKPASTPVDTKSKVSTKDGVPLHDKTFYRSVAGALQYLTITRPKIAYAVQQACLHMHDPHDVHWNIIKRILRYVRGTTEHGVLLRASPSTALTAYTDADWAGCPDTRRSTSGFCIFLGDALVSWSSKRQAVVSRSSAEAEYRGVANAAAECCWLRNLLQELHIDVNKASIIFCDNVSAVYLSDNPVHHKRTKHVELDIHFVRERTALGQLRVLHVPTRYQYADIMTKGLTTALFEEFRDSLCIRKLDAMTEGGC